MRDDDQKFMNRLIELVDRNLDKGTLHIDDLAAELAVSRSVFFKRVKALTGLSPITFIRRRRMSRAAELIKRGEHTIAEVSYLVGVNDPHYFSRCFKIVFGISPSEYREKQAFRM